MRMQKRWIGLAVLLAVPTLAVIAVRFFVDEPLRRTIERNMNQQLQGYTVRIRAVHFHPLDFSLDLIDSTVLQDAHPDPPVAHLPLLRASVHWRALLHRRLVADFLIDRPRLNINLKQAKKEVEDKTPVSERGWQDALEEIYPLKVNQVRVRDADITYVDEGPFKPLRLSRINFRTSNIRNVHSKERVYPSDIHLGGQVFDSGAVQLDGHADFMAEPHAGIEANFSLKHVELDYFKPIILRYHVSVRKGTMSTDGHFEYAPTIKVADLQHVTIQGVQVEYVHRAETEASEKQVARTVVRSAKKLSNDPEILLRVDKVNILKSTFGFVNRATDPEYRLFLADADIRLDNLSNQSKEGTAVGTLKGKFMGSGDTLVAVAFRPKAKSPDMDFKVQIHETKMPAMNGVLLAYGDFDVVDGLFSFYSELTLRDGQIRGYIKPMFRRMKVYDEEQDRAKSFGRRLRKILIGVGAWILESSARDEVATKVDISGTLDSPQFSTWEAVVGLLRNAFIQALLPGLDPKAARHSG